MWVLAYYNNDRIRFRILSVCNDLEEVMMKLKRQTSFDRNRFKILIKEGIFISENNYYVISTSKKPSIPRNVLRSNNYELHIS